MAANESTKYTHFSNLAIGTANGGGSFLVNGIEQSGSTPTTLSTATVLTAADSGTTYILSAAAGVAITLPALSSGLKFKFIVGAAFATSNFVISSVEGTNINGIIASMGAAVAGVPAASETQINFVASAEAIGDWVEFTADFSGSQWLVTGMCATNGGITATAA